MRASSHVLLHLGCGHQAAVMRCQISHARDRGRKGRSCSLCHKRLGSLSSDVWGSDKTYNHMAVGWAWAFDTPFSWTKQIVSHFGGTRQGMAISWPKVITDKGSIRH
jgi:arylsulfatase A-like enzyme